MPHTKVGPKGPAFLRARTGSDITGNARRRTVFIREGSPPLSSTSIATCLFLPIVVTPHIWKTSKNSLDICGDGGVNYVTLGDVKDFDNR